VFIAISGCPLTGKSSLVDELVAGLPGAGTLDCQALQLSGSLALYEDQTVEYDPLGEETLVLERSHIEEYVWPEVFRTPTDMIDPAIRRHVEMFMCSRGCVTIYTIRDYDELHEAISNDPRPLAKPASLALALELYENALSESHSRGFVFEHDHVHHHLSPQDISFVSGQADDDVRPLFGITDRWIGNPQPRWIVATSGYSDQDTPGRQGAGIHPTVAHILRNIPEPAWRGVALVDIEGMSDEGLREFAHLTDPEAWITIGDEAKDRVIDIVHPQRCWSPGYGISQVFDLPAIWGTWTELREEK
jgi:hypothetical protein